MTLLEHAINYAKRGAQVFPLKPNKHPYTEHGMLDASGDLEQIERWWTEHPDALIGCRIPQGQMVLDIDPRHGGDVVWRALVASYGDIEVARQHHSGRGDGGFHAWGNHPGGKLSTKRLTEWAKRNGVATKVSSANAKTKYTCGIDVLHHGHRYTILPPSPHPTNGEPYTWDIEGKPDDFPDWLCDLLAPPDPTPPPASLPQSSSDSIADWYSNTARWSDILNGWHVVGGDGEHDGSKWRHPLATNESSASVKHGCLFVYTDNTGFEQTEADDPHGYTKFRAYADLHHRGNLSDAARAARITRDGEHTTPAPAASEFIEDADSLDEESDIDEADEVDDDWGRYDLVAIAAKIISGDYAPELPTILRVADAMPLLYRGRTHSLFGPPGGGKTWVALAAIAEQLKAGEHVLMVDWEDAAPGTTARLVKLGCTADDIARLDYRAPATSLAYGWVALVASTLAYSLIVMDSTGEALAAQGVNPNDDGEVAGWMSMVKKLTRRPGNPAILLLDHVPKASDNPHGAPIGSQRKLAAITGAAFRCDTLIEPAKGKPGKLKLVVAKDRLGNRAKASTAAEIHMADTGDGIELRFALPEAAAAAARGETFRPTHLMERVSVYVEDNDGASKKQIEENVSGKVAVVRQAIDVLVDEGWIRVVHEGAGKPIRHHVKTSYRESMSVDNYPSTTGGSSPRPPLVPTSSLDLGTTPQTQGSSPRPPSSPRVYNEDRGDEVRTVSEAQGSSPNDGPVDNPQSDPDDLDRF